MRSAVGGARTTYSEVEIGVYGSHCLHPAAMSLFGECGVDSVACHLSQLLSAWLMTGEHAVRQQDAQPPAGMGRE